MPIINIKYHILHRSRRYGLYPLLALINVGTILLSTVTHQSVSCCIKSLTHFTSWFSFSESNSRPHNSCLHSFVGESLWRLSLQIYSSIEAHMNSEACHRKSFYHDRNYKGMYKVITLTTFFHKRTDRIQDNQCSCQLYYVLPLKILSLHDIREENHLFQICR